MGFKVTYGWLIAIACLLCLGPKEGKHTPAPKREFRGVWVATFANLDWPSRKGLSPLVQQAEFEDLLKNLASLGFNAVFVQVRPSGDAFYPSTYEPWSEFLTGVQGTDPGYDPLDFMVEAAHRNNLEFHAWVNPFRAVSHTRFSSLSESHIANRIPHWFFTHGNTLYFNPGVPEVRDYLSCVVMEITEQYDVDGIHFDDYFYPYPKEGLRINDLPTYARYGNQHSDLANWRRNNINVFVKQVSDSLKKYSPKVKFGISPPAVWRNKREHPLGSETQADLTAYENLFADSRLWLQQGWVDYLSPQCYHHHRYNKARFPNLAAWWSDNGKSRHVYIGHAAYKVKEGKWPAWRRKHELPDQIRLGRSLPGIRGSVLYRAGSLEEDPHKLTSELRERLFNIPALPPQMPWKDAVPPLPPKGVEIADSKLSWTSGGLAADMEQAWKYGVYFFPKKHKADLNDPQYIVALTQNPFWAIPEYLERQQGKWAVTAIDRLGNESEAVLIPQPASSAK
jgi:uncharacterized lipoprotein YddW (UPF0748 family)